MRVYLGSDHAGLELKQFLMSRLAERASAWQDEVERLAKDVDLDVVRVGLDRWEMETALVEFTAERRLRKM